MPTIIDTAPGPDGIYREETEADRLAERVKLGLGAAEEFVQGARSVREAFDLVRRHIRSIGKPIPNPRRRLRNPSPVVDAEEV